jgi:hypothetical protein
VAVAPLIVSLRFNSQVGTITKVLALEALKRQASRSQSPSLRLRQNQAAPELELATTGER